MQLFILIPVHRNQCQAVICPLFSDIILIFQNIFLRMHLLLKFRNLQSFADICPTGFFNLFLYDLFHCSGICTIRGQEKIFTGTDCPISIHPGITVQTIREITAMLIKQL